MTKPENDNIELRNFLEYLGGFKSFITHSLRFFFRLIRKNLVILLLPPLLGFSYAAYRYFNSEESFPVEMQLAFNELHKRTYGEMILHLHDHLENEDYALVADALGMTEPEVREIRHLEALNIARSPLHEDMNSDKHPFYVVAEISDRSISQKLQNGIIEYLRNNPLNSERRRINLANMKDRYEFLRQQLAWMDSIKAAYNDQLKSSGFKEKEAEELAIDRLFSLSDSFYQEMLNLRSGIESYKAVELIFGFMPAEKAVRPSIGGLLYKYGLLGLAVSLVMLLWMAIPTGKKE